MEEGEEEKKYLGTERKASAGLVGGREKWRDILRSFFSMMVGLCKRMEGQHAGPSGCGLAKSAE